MLFLYSGAFSIFYTMNNIQNTLVQGDIVDSYE